MPPLPILALIATALLAVAIRNVWFSLLADSSKEGREKEPHSYESLQAIASGLVAYLLLFWAVGHFMTLVPSPTSILVTSTLVFVILIHQHLYQAFLTSKPVRYLAVHIGYGAIVAFGGVAVLHYWPW